MKLFQIDIASNNEYEHKMYAYLVKAESKDEALKKMEPYLVNGYVVEYVSEKLNDIIFMSSC